MHRPLTCVEICAGAGGQALGIACLYLKQPKRPLCRCGKSTKIQVLGGNKYEKGFVL